MLMLLQMPPEMPMPSRTARDFRDPPPVLRPMLRWWWPGAAADTGALIEQLRGFAAAGWGGVEIQPCRIGLPQPLPADLAERVHAVFTPPGWQQLAQVMAEAERLGLRVETTFGSAWPFGGGETITPALAHRELSLDWTPVRGPGRWSGRPRQPQRPRRNASWLARRDGIDPSQVLPSDWQQTLEHSSTLVAVLAVRGSAPVLAPFDRFVPMTLPDRWGTVVAAGQIDAGSTIDLKNLLQPDGSLDWDVPEGDWQIVICREFISDQMLLEAAGRGPQLLADPLNRSAFDAHAQRVGSASLPWCAEHAGRSWQGIFVDSLEIQADLFWSSDLAEEFQQRRGYRLEPFLPLLLQPGWCNHFQAREGAALFDDEQAGPRVRADYRRTVSELMLERLYAPFADWARRHGLKARIQAHGAPVDLLEGYGLADVPETEDLATGAAPHFLRLARSAAHQQGRALVSGEAFCWLHEGLAVTPQQLRERADAFFAAGIQQLVGHGASARVAGWTGAHPWYPFEAMEIGTLLDEASPWWSMIRPLTDYLGRCQTLLRRGQARVPVAVLAPADLFAFAPGGQAQPDPAWHRALLSVGLDWDWINPAGLQRCRLEAGALVSPGGVRYRAVVLPDLTALDAETAERLAECAAAGVVVRAFGGVPQQDSGWLDADRRDARVRRAMRAALGLADIGTASAIGQALLDDGLQPALPLPPGSVLPPGLAFHVREDLQDGSEALTDTLLPPHQQQATIWIFLSNAADQPCSIPLLLQPDQFAQDWEARDGRVLALPGETVLTVDLAPRRSRWLRLARRQPPRRIALPGPWTLEARGTDRAGHAVHLQTRIDQVDQVDRMAALADFAGHLRLNGTLVLPEAVPAGLRLELGAVHGAASVRIGREDAAPVVLFDAPFTATWPHPLPAGEHPIEILIANVVENARRDPQRPGGIARPGRRLHRLPIGLPGPITLQFPDPVAEDCHGI